MAPPDQDAAAFPPRAEADASDGAVRVVLRGPEDPVVCADDTSGR